MMNHPTTSRVIRPTPLLQTLNIHQELCLVMLFPTYFPTSWHLSFLLFQHASLITSCHSLPILHHTTQPSLPFFSLLGRHKTL